MVSRDNLDTEHFGLSPCWRDIPGGQYDLQSLFDWWRGHDGFSSKSIPNVDINFYADLVERHRSSGITALRLWNGTVFAAISYQDLHDQIELLVKQWLQRPITPGATILIVSSSLLRRIVGVLAALRIGLVSTVITPQGMTRLVHQAHLIDPDFIYADRDIGLHLPDDLKSRLCPTEGYAEIAVVDSHHFKPGDEIIRVYDPYHLDSTPITLTAASFFASLIRDAYQVLGLNKGGSLAGFPVLAGLSPNMELAVLLTGATFFGLDAPAVAFPQVRIALEREVFDVVHLPRVILSSLCNLPFKTAPIWGRWFRDPVESLDTQEWSNNLAKIQVDRIPNSQLHWSRQTGTIIFGSCWSESLASPELFPIPGITWHLGNLSCPEQESKNRLGVYSQIIGCAKDSICLPSPLMLAEFNGAYRYVGSHPRGRSGIPYPTEMAKKALKSTMSYHVILERETGNDIGTIDYVLVAFCDNRSKSDLIEILRCEIGEDAVPDDVVMIPYYPRMDDEGFIDESWIKRNFLSGELDRRIGVPVYEKISAFKVAIQRDAINILPTSTFISGAA